MGEATCDNDNVFGLAPNSKALNESAKKRINQYTQTAGIAYDLLYTELTIYNSKYGLCSFNDKEVHSVLERSGIKKKIFDTENKANEWFITDLETVKRAIIAVKEGRESLSSAEVSHDKSPIVFRPEQREAIEKTKKQFKKGNQMLWNAKMRFGKTLSALQEVKDMDFSRTLILTHRPVVDSGWFEDFGKIFYDRRDFAYGSKNNGDSHTSLETRAKQGQCKYVYFASMQDLRGSELVGGNFDKNNEVFATAWDCIIVDEAHEGTQTDLGKAVMQELTKDKTKILRLSGTPFNLLDDFKEDEIYTWDYVMEQKAKNEWKDTDVLTGYKVERYNAIYGDEGEPYIVEGPTKLVLIQTDEKYMDQIDRELESKEEKHKYIGNYDSTVKFHYSSKTATLDMKTERAVKALICIYIILTLSVLNWIMLYAMHEMEKKEKTEREQFLIFMGMDKDERKKMNRREWYVYWIIPTIILVISTAFFMRDTMVARMYTEDMREICELQEIELLIIWIVINGIYFWIMNRKVGKELKADDK